VLLPENLVPVDRADPPLLPEVSPFPRRHIAVLSSPYCFFILSLPSVAYGPLDEAGSIPPMAFESALVALFSSRARLVDGPCSSPSSLIFFSFESLFDAHSA